MPRLGRRRDLVSKKCFFGTLAGAVRCAARRVGFENVLRSTLADDVIDSGVCPARLHPSLRGCDDGQYYYDGSEI